MKADQRPTIPEFGGTTAEQPTALPLEDYLALFKSRVERRFGERFIEQTDGARASLIFSTASPLYPIGVALKDAGNEILWEAGLDKYAGIADASRDKIINHSLCLRQFLRVHGI